jgi:signal transduction histidine kinase
MDCRFECPQTVLVEDINVATHLYRIAQEAISNAHRHGKAKAILMRLDCLDGSLRLRIKDDGGGFDPHGNGSDGMGLKIMAHRAKACNGSVEVISCVGKGTEVICLVSAASVRIGD